MGEVLGQVLAAQRTTAPQQACMPLSWMLLGCVASASLATKRLAGELAAPPRV